MSEYFKRQTDILGENSLEILRKKSIAIVGCGGLGCTISIALGGSGVGNIHLIDFDTIAIHNIHRQIAFKIDDENKYKSDVVKDVLKSRIQSGFDIQSHTCTFLQFCEKGLQVDLLIDATDNLFARSEINKYAKKQNIPWLYASVEEYNGQICFFDKANFDDTFKVQPRPPKGQTAPMVMQIASFSANQALRYLANLPVKKDKLYYHYFDSQGECKVQSFDVQKS